VLVGTVTNVLEDNASNFYTLHLKPGTNFYNVEYVTVVDNIQKDEQKKLEEAARKNQ
jgi:rod shape-determining protein MreC